MNCPLCGAGSATRFAPGYQRCVACELTWMDAALRPGPDVERARYDEHRNDPDDAGYRSFLERVAGPVAELVPVGSRGLDYGSGPGPTLSLMLKERGYDVALYDPYYADDPGVLLDRYDFITCTEVAEHFFNPAAEFARLSGLLREGGLLVVMTEPLEDSVAFGNWYYRRDPTHVCFYRPATMQWIAERYGWTLQRPSRSVFVFGSPTGSR